MEIYCLDEFKTEFEKLSARKQYNSLERDLIDYFFDKSVDELCSGIRLNNSFDTPYIKKRINGSGGFRLYYLLIIKDNCLYLMFVHPKTGPSGAENVTETTKALLYKKVLECIGNKNLFKVELDNKRSSLLFTHCSQANTPKKQDKR